MRTVQNNLVGKVLLLKKYTLSKLTEKIFRSYSITSSQKMLNGNLTTVFLTAISCIRNICPYCKTITCLENSVFF